MTPLEISEVVNGANEAFRKLQLDVLQKYLSPKTCYLGSAMNLLYSSIDLLAPGAGTSLTVLAAALQGRSAEKVRWQGFLASQEFRGRVPLSGVKL
jgi:hypothetical protein